MECAPPIQAHEVGAAQISRARAKKHAGAKRMSPTPPMPTHRLQQSSLPIPIHCAGASAQPPLRSHAMHNCAHSGCAYAYNCSKLRQAAHFSGRPTGAGAASDRGEAQPSTLKKGRGVSPPPPRPAALYAAAQLPPLLTPHRSPHTAHHTPIVPSYDPENTRPS